MDAVKRIWDRPGAVLVVGAAVVALAFPATTAGSIALAIIAGTLGVAVASALPQLREWLEQYGASFDAFVLAMVFFVGVTTFWETMTESPDWQVGDWGPQHAAVRGILPWLPGLDVPVWNHAMSTGDAPLELYPAFTYIVVGHFARAFGLEGDLPLAFMIVAVLVHVGLAVLTAALAMKLASRKLAFVVALFFLVDTGAVSHGGTVGMFRWAILHSAFAHVFSMIAILGIVGMLHRPRVSCALAIWLGTAVGTATHPAALLTAAACAVALIGVTLLAGNVPPRRALVALGHLMLGVAIGALVWMPASQRLLLYGQHFSNELYTPIHFLQLIMTTAMPMTVYSLFVYLGYVGTMAGMFSRRADVVFIAIAAFVLMLGICNLPYLGLGLLPKIETARFGVIRMMMLVRPLIFALAAYTLSLVGTRIGDAWKTAPARQRMVAAALLGVIAGAALRIAPEYWRAESQRAYETSRVYADDALGRRELVGWAHVQAAGIGPHRWARALFEIDTHEQLHLTALTGLPTLHMGPIPGALLRERIEDTSAESLARFNVRWIVGVDKEPVLGDPATEIKVGSFRIREVAEWDGKFARIERGTGNVVVHRLDAHGVEIEVTGTTEPVLVALGMGYYPRWRARHASGAAEPVYALPATKDGRLHVVSAWVAPGRTTFTCDGPLPSDGAGRPFALLALLVIVAGLVAWSRPRWRVRILRKLALARRRAGRLLPLVLQGGAVVIVLGLALRGCLASRAPAVTFQVGSGLRSVATVEARVGEGTWRACSYQRLRGVYDCDGLAVVEDATVNLLNDAAPSWALISPAVVATAYDSGIEVRVTRKLRLAGRYWAASSPSSTLQLGDDVPATLTTARKVLDVDDAERSVVISGVIPYPSPLSVTLVAESRIDPPRPHLAPPPETAPATVRAIR